MTPEKPGWRPIAEAPRDGTLVLLWDPSESEVVIGFGLLGGRRRFFHYPGEWAVPAKHWMPLPPAPDSADG